jgi:Fis family transcriptional regulator
MIDENEIAACVRKAVREYFTHLDGEKPYAIYEMVIACVEKPLLEVVLDHTQGNQTRASEILGLNRNTLRKKMKSHGIK